MLFIILSVLFALIVPLAVFVFCHYNRHRACDGRTRHAAKIKLDELHPAEAAMLRHDGGFKTDFFWSELVRLGN